MLLNTTIEGIEDSGSGKDLAEDSVEPVLQQECWAKRANQPLPQHPWQLCLGSFCQNGESFCLFLFSTKYYQYVVFLDKASPHASLYGCFPWQVSRDGKSLGNFPTCSSSALWSLEQDWSSRLRKRGPSISSLFSRQNRPCSFNSALSWSYSHEEQRGKAKTKYRNPELGHCRV